MVNSSPHCLYLVHSTNVLIGRTLRHCLAIKVSVHSVTGHYPGSFAREYTLCNNLTLKFPTLPPLRKGSVFANKLGSLLVVQLQVCVATSPKLLALLVFCHLITLPLSCPIQPVQCWGDKGSANSLVLPRLWGNK